MSFLEVRNLKKYFNTNAGALHAVDDVSFSVERGKTIGIVGESGCGKSTLGRVVIHLLDNNGGQILFDGEDITNPDRRRRRDLFRDMQMIFQDPYSSLDPRKTVSSIIAEPLKIDGKLSKKEIDDEVNNLMQHVGLDDYLYNAYPHELDGGRRQRIGIARALALNPKFIVCDEPVSALDVSIQAQVLNLMMDLQEARNLTYMFISHNLSVVKHISDEICVMYLGQIVERSPKEELFRNPVHPYTQALLSAITIPKIRRDRQRIVIKGEPTSPVNPAPGCRFASRCPYATDECRQPQKTIEVSNGHFAACRLAVK